MIKYNSQSAKIQDKNLLTGLESKVLSNSCDKQFAEYLGNEPKQLFVTSTSPQDGGAWYEEQLEKKRIISENGTN